MDILAFAVHFFGEGLQGWVLLAEAAALGIYFYRKDRCLVSLRLLLSVFWIGGEGLAAFRLSRLHTEWTAVTWLCFSFFYLLFLLGFDLACGLHREKEQEGQTDGLPSGRRFWKRMLPKWESSGEQFQKRLFHCILIMTAVPLAAFVFEALWLGYIPLFSTETHAYDHFHISGVHYFTVSSIFVPALGTIYLLNRTGRLPKKTKAALLLCNLIAFAIPVMCVSKFQIAITVLLPVILFLLMRQDIPGKYLALGAAAVAVGLGGMAVFMTISRHYPPGYLNSVFEMRDEKMPVIFQYVYMYIANNYANFNELTIAVGTGKAGFAFGMRELFPVFALTGLKFVFPQLVNYPVFVTKETLNTLTIIYDAYYDFGIAGVVIFSAVLGAVCGRLTMMAKPRGDGAKAAKNPVLYLFYGQIAMYVMLSFFSAWFTVPTTWFWLAVTAALYFYTSGAFVGIEKKKKLCYTDALGK